MQQVSLRWGFLMFAAFALLALSSSCERRQYDTPKTVSASMFGEGILITGLRVHESSVTWIRLRHPPITPLQYELRQWAMSSAQQEVWQGAVQQLQASKSKRPNVVVDADTVFVRLGEDFCYGSKGSPAFEFLSRLDPFLLDALNYSPSEILDADDPLVRAFTETE